MSKIVPPSGYRAMWLFAMFDLPVGDKKQRREYSKFRKLLVANGFQMIQFSVYARYCTSEEAATTTRRRIKRTLPHEGQVRLVRITDRQFAKMEIYTGRKPTPPEAEPTQLSLF